jgi:hypothetical protein
VAGVIGSEGIVAAPPRLQSRSPAMALTSGGKGGAPVAGLQIDLQVLQIDNLSSATSFLVPLKNLRRELAK